MNLKGVFGNSRIVKIFGAQDYMVIVEGGISSDAGHELNAMTHPMLREQGYFGILCIEDSDTASGIHIHPIYSGNWSFAICPSEEDGKMPEWLISRSWGSVNSHSETLEIEVPKSATLRVLPPIESQPKIQT